MTRTFVLSWLAYLVPTFALGYFWHLKLFQNLYRDLGIYRPELIIPFGFLSMLLQGAIFALVYPKLFVQPEQVSNGLMFGSGAALLSWSYTTIAVAAKHPMTSVRRFVGIETLFTVAQFLPVGLLLPVASRT